jgi:hypothetical protein
LLYLQFSLKVIIKTVKMLGKDADGKLKRIEYRGRYLRASRTGGVALRAQTEAAGLNLTVNSNRGVRVSTRVAKGTQVALQNGRFVLRGRYGKGPSKINLSKSGVSVSTKTGLGTVNWFKPRYSSAKFAGIQFRGKNALVLMVVVGLAQLLYAVAVLLAQLLVLTVQVIWLGVSVAWAFIVERFETFRERRLARLEGSWTEQLRVLERQQLEAGLDLVLLFLAKGKQLQFPEGNFADDSLYGQMERLIWKLLTSTQIPRALRMEVLFSCLAVVYLEKAGEAAALEQFKQLDTAAMGDGGRNELQERLLGAYALAVGIEMV